MYMTISSYISIVCTHTYSGANYVMKRSQSVHSSLDDTVGHHSNETVNKAKVLKDVIAEEDNESTTVT